MDWSFWRGLLIWALAALLIRWAVIEPRWIPSGSMLPTLQLQDRILVEKSRPRLSHQLHLGDVVVFSPPARLTAGGYDPSAALIKRLVKLQVRGPGWLHEHPKRAGVRFERTLRSYQNEGRIP